jgi:hypothetical protein
MALGDSTTALSADLANPILTAAARDSDDKRREDSIIVVTVSVVNSLDFCQYDIIRVVTESTTLSRDSLSELFPQI